MRTAIIWFSIGLLVTNLKSQPIWFSGDQDVMAINPFVDVYKTSDTLTFVEVLDKINRNELQEVSTKTSPGFSESIFWVHFKVVNPDNNPLLLELNNPHIDYAYLYEIYPKEGLIGIGGDRMSFNQRTNLNRRFIFLLDGRDSTEYLLQLDKRFASMSFPLKLWKTETFYEQENKDQLLFGVFFGILVFIGISSLLAGIGLKDRLFLYYSFYILTMFIYLFTNLGLSFQYFYPNSSSLNSYTRVFMAVFSSIFGTIFFRRFLNVNVYYPVVYKALSGIVLFMLVMITGWVFFKASYEAYYLFTIPLLNLFYFLQFTIILLLFWVLFRTYSRQPNTVLVFILAFGSVLGGSILFILVEYGLVSELNFPLNPIMIGSIIEVFLFSGSMILRLKSINDARNQLANKINEQQKELMRAFIRGGERERNRISGELHDHIGSQLSLFKMKIKRTDFTAKEMDHDLDVICNDIRLLAHQLVPHEMEIAGFINTLKSHCKNFEANSQIKIDLDIYSFPDIDPELSVHLFRIIEEALHNIEKHAQAGLVEIQLIGYDREIVITIDDDGQGFDPKNLNYGLGIASMRSRAEAYQGTFEISSTKGKGTNLILKIPYQVQDIS